MGGGGGGGVEYSTCVVGVVGVGGVGGDISRGVSVFVWSYGYLGRYGMCMYSQVGECVDAGQGSSNGWWGTFDVAVQLADKT